MHILIFNSNHNYCVRITAVSSLIIINFVTHVTIQTITKTVNCRDTHSVLFILNDFELDNVVN